MIKKLVILLQTMCLCSLAMAQDFMINVVNREQQLLNGKWNIIIDQYDVGIKKWKAIYKDASVTQPNGRTEYRFEGGNVLDVPGDFNSQLPELKFYESTIWYKKVISMAKEEGKRQFLYFDAINYKADVFLNSEKLGSHVGGFTPFQFEITNKLKDGDNSIIIRVNNQRDIYGVPSTGYDWFNYGGITRDVRLVKTPSTFIDDYKIQLAKGSKDVVSGYVKLNGINAEQDVVIEIPEAKVKKRVTTDKNGFAKVNIKGKFKLWSPKNPKLYDVIISSQDDKVTEQIGFRTIEVKGEDILLNGKPIFLRGVNFHEEAAERSGRAYSESDALVMLTRAKELGCNFIRTAHYPQNEYVVRMAEQMGFMLWEEVPVFQSIAFGDKKTVNLMYQQLHETIHRDKNRCGVIIWSISNETSPTKLRTTVLTQYADSCRKLDDTRLVSAAFNKYKKSGNVLTLDDALIDALDVIGMNEYLGWYGGSFYSEPKEDEQHSLTLDNFEWKSPYNKPMIITEYGAEAIYGKHGNPDVSNQWNEEFQEAFYIEQVEMQQKIPFLRGTCPWALIDFRSPLRMHPEMQNYWNRKGLLGEKGEKKKAWYVVKKYYGEF